MMKRLCKRHVTGTTGRTHTGEDMATAKTWADLISLKHTHVCASLQFPQINLPMLPICDMDTTESGAVVLS